MSKIMTGCLTLVFAVALVQAQAPNSGPAPTYTVITLEQMHCDGCAKRIAGKLYEVPGVDKIQVDVPKKLLWVLPKPGQQPSPRKLWEAVEKGNDRPTKLHGPYGVFTTKPQS